MIQEAVVQKLQELIGADGVLVQEPMSRQTTFRVGGAADLLLRPATVEQIAATCAMLREWEVPFLILGNGSNVLVGDRGIRGAVVQMSNAFSHCTVEGETMTAEAGIKLSRLAACALEHSLTGLEFAAGIPGTLGGALFMNAGAYGGEMKQVVESVRYLDEDGALHEIAVEDCHYGYRSGIFLEHPEYVIVGCRLRLSSGDPKEIKAKMDDLAQRRVDKQPLNYPSAGSTFKRPEGNFAGKLIQDAGLMGLRVGGASVSTKHAGFVVNDQNATAAEICALMEEVQTRVKEQFGVTLQPEVRMIGEF